MGCVALHPSYNFNGLRFCDIFLKGRECPVASGNIARPPQRSNLAESSGKAGGLPQLISADYLLGYPGMLHYDEFLAVGLSIASGVIEGACRHLINDRMDITGARWSLQGAEAILKLRSLRSSGDFDDY